MTITRNSKVSGPSLMSILETTYDKWATIVAGTAIGGTCGYGSYRWLQWGADEYKKKLIEKALPVTGKLGPKQTHRTLKTE